MNENEDTRRFHRSRSDDGEATEPTTSEQPKMRMVAIPDEEERPHDLELSDTLRKPDAVAKILEEMHVRGEENKVLKTKLSDHEATIQRQQLMLRKLEIQLATRPTPVTDGCQAPTINDHDALARDQIQNFIVNGETPKALVRIHNVGSTIIVDKTVRGKPIEHVKPPDKNDWFMAYGDGVEGVGLAKSQTQGDNTPTVESPRSPIMDFMIGIFLLGFIVSGGVALAKLLFGPDGFNDECKTWLFVSAFCFIFAGFIALVTDETDLAQD